jgi:hypothetical protein
MPRLLKLSVFLVLITMGFSLSVVLGNSAEMVKFVRSLANKGDANSQHYLGTLYENGPMIWSDEIVFNWETYLLCQLFYNPIDHTEFLSKCRLKLE